MANYDDAYLPSRATVMVGVKSLAAIPGELIIMLPCILNICNCDNSLDSIMSDSSKDITN